MTDISPPTLRLDRPGELALDETANGDGYALEGPATNRIDAPPPTLRDTPVARASTLPPPWRPYDPATTAAKLCALATKMWGPASWLPDSKLGGQLGARANAITSPPPPPPPPSSALPPTRR